MANSSVPASEHLCCKQSIHFSTLGYMISLMDDVGRAKREDAAE